MLERVSDSATFTQALRLLVLFIQHDAHFALAFYQVRGWPALRTILCCRPAAQRGAAYGGASTGHSCDCDAHAHLEEAGGGAEPQPYAGAVAADAGQVTGPPWQGALASVTHPVFAVLMEVVTVHVPALLRPPRTQPPRRR